MVILIYIYIGGSANCWDITLFGRAPGWLWVSTHFLLCKRRHVQRTGIQLWQWGIVQFQFALRKKEEEISEPRNTMFSTAFLDRDLHLNEEGENKGGLLF